MAERQFDAPGVAGSLVLEQRFAVVPEWVIDADVSDCAYRLYSVLLRYGQTSGRRMPARATLAARLHKASTDTVDRALKELVTAGAVIVERRRRPGGEHLTNRYHLMATPPSSRTARTASAAQEGGSRKSAATPGRRDAATVAADLRPDPGVPTQKNPPPGPLPAPDVSTRSGVGEPDSGGAVPAVSAVSARDAALLAACAITDIEALAADCQALRRRLGKPVARWSADRLLDAIRYAVLDRGHPALAAVPALRMVAADPATHSPARLGCPGPWWHTNATGPRPQLSPAEVAEQDALETRLGDADGARVWAQQQAREQLTSRGEPVTRLAVARLACQLLDQAELSPC